eukprot:6560506-Alexandrium_andersonii.AAC.1
MPRPAPPSERPGGYMLATASIYGTRHAGRQAQRPVLRHRQGLQEGRGVGPSAEGDHPARLRRKQE